MAAMPASTTADPARRRAGCGSRSTRQAIRPLTRMLASRAGATRLTGASRNACRTRM